MKETIIFEQPNYPVKFKLVLVINPKFTNKDNLSSPTMSRSHLLPHANGVSRRLRARTEQPRVALATTVVSLVAT